MKSPSCSDVLDDDTTQASVSQVAACLVDRYQRADNLLIALASGKRNEDAIETLWVAAQTWLRYGGGMPMERFAGLPLTGAALTIASRNIWLRNAADCLQEEKRFALAQRLAAELEIFITRGPWVSWRDQVHPPMSASELRRALFYAAKFNDGACLSVRQIYRVLP